MAVPVGGVADAHGQLLHLEGLGQEVVGPGAQRGDRQVEIAEGRDEDDRHVGPAGVEPLAQLEAGHPTEPHVGHDHLVVGDVHGRERLGSADHVTRLEAAPREVLHDQGSHRGVVFDKEYGCRLAEGHGGFR
jgi:hypothetical protein